MQKIKNLLKKSFVCLLLIVLILGGNFLWLSNSKVYGDTVIKYGTVTEPAGLNNVLLDDNATETVSFNQQSIAVKGFSSSNLGEITSIDVFFKIPSATIDTSKGATANWNLKFYYGTNLSTDFDTVKTGTNVAPNNLETKSYSTKPNGGAWQWSDIQNFKLAMETTYNKASGSVFNVDSFYIRINYNPLGDTEPPNFTLSYYSDESLTVPLPIQNGLPLTKAQTVYVKAEANESLAADPTITISAPDTGNDVNNQGMTYKSGYYVYPWTISSGMGDGQATIQVTGEDLANNSGTTSNSILIDTMVNTPNLNASAGHVKVDLSWSTTDTDVKEYKLYRSTEPNFTLTLDKLLKTFTSQILSYTDTNVLLNQDYYYKLVAIDNAGNISLPSTEIDVTPFEDTSLPEFRVEYYTDPSFSNDNKLSIWQESPITNIQTVYLKIEASEDLKTNPTVSIDAYGTFNDISTGLTQLVNARTYRYTWNLQNDPNADGLANILVSGEDLNGNQVTDFQPEVGGQIRIDTHISQVQWGPNYPIGGLGFVDLAWNTLDTDIKAYRIYRDIQSDFVIDEVNNTNLLLSTSRSSHRDTTANAPNTYYYKVVAVDYAGNTSVSAENYGIPEKVNPHGNYVSDTNMCAQCHQAHGGKDKYNLKDKTKLVCYVCHDAGGQSIYNVRSELNLQTSHHPVDLQTTSYPVDSQSCSDCHNPHLDWETVPRLLTTKNNSMAGNEVCWTCHGNSAGTIGDKKTNYPTLGVGHNNNTWTAPNGLKPFSGQGLEPSAATNIGCIGCHEEHGSSLAKLLKSADWNNDTVFPSQNNKNFCYECHKDPLSSTADNAWDGRAIYDNYAQGLHQGSGAQCTNCHDPHGSVNGNYLKGTYDITNRGVTRTKAFDGNDYQTCTNCHTISKLMDITDPIANTGFSDGRADWPKEKQNLHYYHLNQLASKGLGNAVCKECHRPHGSLPAENPNRKHLVGFPSSTVTVISGKTTPEYNHPVDSEIGGSCMLSCHGVTHKNENVQEGEINSSYYGGTPPAGGGLSDGGQDCITCHNNNTDTSKKLVDRMKATTGGFKHLIDSTNNFSYIYDPNSASCTNTCHVDHDKFNNNMGANLRASVNDTSPSSGENTDFIAANTDGGICTSCHQNTQNKRYDTGVRGLFSKIINPVGYGLSAHNYEVTTNFSYDGSAFNANCVKCHNDNMGKDSTGSPVMNREFALHESSYKDALFPFNILNPPNPLGQKHCYGCHGASGEYYSTPNQIAGDVETDFNKSYRHKIESTATWDWDNCNDCHNTHLAKKGNRVSGTGGGTIDFTKVAPSMVGATGVYPNQWQAPPPPTAGTETLWSPADAAGYTEITLKETDPAYYASYVCLKCHSSYVSNLPRLGDGEMTRDKVKDLNPNNPTFHPVFGTSKNVWLSSSANRQNALKPPWNTTSQASTRMTCMDCHNAPSNTSGPFGVHGSSNPFMLRATGPEPTVSGSAGPYDKLCYLCHVPTNSSFRTHLNSAHGTNDLGCLACHAGPAGKVTANNGGRRGAIHGANFKWASGTQVTTMLMGGYIADITGRNCTANGCTTHNKAW